MWSDTNKVFFNTNPVDQNAAKAAVINLYNFCYRSSLNSNYWKSSISTAPSSNPKVVFVDGPTELGKRIADESPSAWTSLERFNDITHFVSKRSYGNRERVRSIITQIFHAIPYKGDDSKGCDSPLFDVVEHMYNRDNASEWEKLASEVWNQTYICFTFTDVCYVVNRPLFVKSNERGLHCKDGPAVVFRDGTEIYAYEGILTTEKNIRHPEQMTLKDVHQHNSRKHILIDLCGVERYLELCKAWKPDVKGKFQKFFSMEKMVQPLKPDAKEWEKPGYGHMYVDNPYTIKFSHESVNDNRALCLRDEYNLYSFWDDHIKHVFDWKHSESIFERHDRELWDLFDVNEVFKRGGHMGFTVSFQNGIFSISSQYREEFKSCRHDVAPSWFKAKMFRGQDALYENHELNYVIKHENGRLLYDGDIEEGGSCISANEPSKPIKVRSSLFSGCENIPHYQFDIDLQSNSWEGLLEKWAVLSFNWLGMHEDSTRLP